MKRIIHRLIFFYYVITFLIGCAAIQRNIYFRDLNSKYFHKTLDSRFPGLTAFVSLEKRAPESSSELNVEVENRSEGQYLFGIIIPVIPTMFLPDNDFKIDEFEKIKINCAVRDYAKRDFVNGECLDVEIVISNGNVHFPTVTEDNIFSGKFFDKTFIFDLIASNLSEFQFRVKRIKLNSGEIIDTPKTIYFVKEDWTRYRIY